MVTRHNSELANDLGNLLSRTLNLLEKNFDGKLTRAPQQVNLADLKTSLPEIEQAYAECAFQDVLETLMKVVRQANLFMETNAPWKLAKTDKAKCEEVLAECFAVMRWLACGFYPFMPDSCEKMWSQLGQETRLAESAHKVLSDPLSGLTFNTKVTKGDPLFPRKE